MKSASLAAYVPLLLPLGLLLSGCAPDASKVDWRTKAERTGYRETARYQETVDYCLNLERCCPWVRVFTIGRTPEGREMAVVVVSRERAFTPQAAAASGKAVVLITNGVHSGEIEGKDASLALLREICIERTRQGLLDNVILLVLPVFNIDGHERFSPYNRINQNGPTEMGWRCTSENLNLNRDYAKADSAEMRAWLDTYHAWRPHLTFDTHTTDGADYQHDISFVSTDGPETATAVAAWVRQKLHPYMLRTLREDGHKPIIFFDLRDRLDPAKGLEGGGFAPRFSTGYGAITNRPSILVETHMLKPYEVRVMSTHNLLARTLELVNSDPQSLMNAVAEGDAADRRLGDPGSPRGKVVLTTTRPADDPGEPVRFEGYAHTMARSQASGTEYPVWDRARPVSFDTRYYGGMRTHQTATAPMAYIIPPQWVEVIDRLILHGQNVRRLKHTTELEVESYRFSESRWAEKPFEGRVSVSFQKTPIREKRFYLGGSAVVRLNGPMSRVAVHLLEPDGPDSLVRWGFFNSIFEQKEYFEDYALAPIADAMLRDQPVLAEEFRKWLAADPARENDPRARLNWFFQHSPYWDARKDIYPVGRIMDPKTLSALPLE